MVNILSGQGKTLDTTPSEFALSSSITGRDLAPVLSDLRPWPDSFYRQSTVEVARALLGSWLVRRVGRGRLAAGRIVETEAYPPGDRASHSFRGMTKRNAPMFGPPGTSYVYRIYGIYYCFNVVTEAEGVAAAVLVRGIDQIAEANGPGKLCRRLGIDHGLNQVDLTSSASGLWIERGRLSYPVEEVTIAGNFRDMLRGIEMVANDLRFRGKIAAPTIKVRRMMVSGD